VNGVRKVGAGGTLEGALEACAGRGSGSLLGARVHASATQARKAAVRCTRSAYTPLGKTR